VFIGTTNEHAFLTANQNRRVWPIKLVVDVIDNDKLRENLEQMWAEALVEFKKRLADAKGDTHRIYFGLSDKAVVEARSLQDSIRLESTEDSDAPAIQDFLEKPVSLRKFLSEDGFEDLDDDGDVTVLRVSTNTTQCSVEALGEELPSNRTRVPLHKIVRALHAVPGWITYEDWSARNGVKSDKLTVPGYTRNRGFVRKNATWDEIALGYRVIEAEEEGSM
jgi:hypothetical protein